MIISNTAVKNRTSVVILALIIIIMGIYSYNILPREDEPDITIPYVFVSTIYKGVSSSDIETSITIPIEKKLKGLEGVEEIKSASSEGKSQINIEFVPGTQIEDVLQKVKDKVDEAKRDLPTDLEDDPSVYEVNLSERPIIVYSLSGSCGIVELKNIADNLEEDFESVTGVLEVDVTGGVEREIIIEVDPDKLAYFKIPITAFADAVTRENKNTSGGSITLGEGRFQLRVPGEFTNPDDIYDLVVTTYNSEPVYLRDLARVVDGFKDEESRSRLDGVESVNIAVKKRSGENIIKIVEATDKIIAQKKSLWPEGTKITKLMDKAKGIELMVIDLENNILSGLILVVIVLLFALGIRNALLVGLAIPFSMFLSFIVLQSIGITLNMVVLFSLTLALGMLVDNAIVIVENIYRYMEQGVPRVEAARKASSEVAYPIIGSTLTTVAAFFPMIYWPGIMGEFMKYLPITLIVTLLSSLFVALIINPALTAIFMRVKKQTNQDDNSNVDAELIAQTGEKPIEIKGWVLKFYSSFLDYALNNRVSVLVISFIFLIIQIQIWLLVIGIEKPVEFFPNIDPQNVYVNIDSPEGADIEYIDRIVKKVEIAVCNIGKSQKVNDENNSVKDDKNSKVNDDINSIKTNKKNAGFSDEELYKKSYIPVLHSKSSGETFYGPSDINNVEHIYATSKRSGSSKLFSSSSANQLGISFVDFEDRKTLSALDIGTIRERISDIPGARITVEEEKGGPPTGSAINIEISGDNFKTLGEIAKKIRTVVGQIPFIYDVRDDYMDAIPSVQVKIDRQKAAIFGLSTNSIGYALKIAYNGLNISTYREGDDDYDITVKLPESKRQVTDNLYSLIIPTPTGSLVPLTTLATINYSGSIGDINRINHSRVVTVKANVDETKIPSAVARMQAEKLVGKMILPTGYKAIFTGENEHQKKSEEFLEKAFIIALCLIFLILVTLFNSVSQPLIIMTSVILSLGGVFLGLAIMRFPFGIIMTGVGVISLAGVVVNNAIVLIDYINKLRERGMEINEAIMAAGATRFRPVMLTAITTVLGLIPMVTGVSINFSTMSISLVSETSQYWQSMSIVVIFGLLVATFLTLLVVPALYSLLSSITERR